MSTFNIGDIVTCIQETGPYSIGQTLTVHSTQDDYLRFSEGETNNRAGYSDHCFSKIEAKKDNEGKPRLDILFRLPILRSVAIVFTEGEKKYPSVNGDFNWRSGKGNLEYKMKLIGAAGRHILAYCTGEKIDPEYGQPHLAHAICDLLMVADIEILEGN